MMHENLPTWGHGVRPVDNGVFEAVNRRTELANLSELGATAVQASVDC